MITGFRISPQFSMNFAELVVDNFAGGGGASTGIEAALGRPVDIAINHDPAAVAMHEVNHPQTRHYCESVWDIDPVAVCGGRPVGLVWFSPDCKHFSKAKGGKPVEKKIRGLAWVVLKWAGTVKPRIIMLENVEEFVTWGPLITGPDGSCRPCPANKGRTFRSFVNALRSQGYEVEYSELRASDYGAPTIRKRFFLIARRDGVPIVWPEPTHGDPLLPDVKSKLLLPWRTAAECIDWTIPTPSIFDRKRPLADATLRRIAKGVMRYVVNSPEPFIINTRNGERAGQQPRIRSIQKPAWTITAQGSQHALCTAFLAKHYGGVVGSALDNPMGTVTSIDHHSLVTAHVMRQFGKSTGSHASAPLGTITAGGGGKSGLVTSHLIKTVPQAGDAVRAFLLKYYGSDQDPRLKEPLHTVTTKDRFGLVTVRGEQYRIADIGLRMLAPRELFRAQGFPDSYIFTGNNEDVTKTSQVARCGNSVCPPVSEVLVRSNMVVSAFRRKAA